VVEPFIEADQGSEIDDQVYFPPENLEGVSGQPKVGARDISRHYLDLVAKKWLEPLPVACPEPIKDGGAEDLSLSPKADCRLGILSGVRTNQENDSADLGQLPQNSLEQHLSQEASAASHQQNLISKECSSFTHRVAGAAESSTRLLCSQI
jgi:hypothetical protein